MAGFETLTFITPVALTALVILPVIYWLLRHTPPKPRSIVFPPMRLLLELVSKSQESDKTPLWLVLLRLALAAALIVAVAQPVLTNKNRQALAKTPLLIIIDNDWASAADWTSLHPVLMQTIAAARTKAIAVALAPTNPPAGPGQIRLQSAAQAKAAAAILVPQAMTADRAKLLARITASFAKVPALQVVWLSSGLGDRQTLKFVRGLEKLAGGTAQLTILASEPKNLPVILSAPKRNNGKIAVTVKSFADSRAATSVTVNLLAANGRSLAAVPVRLSRANPSATATISLPLALRNEAARLEIAGQKHAAAVFLLDDNWRRKSVGMIDAGSLDLEQPLLSPLYYVSRALAPTTHVRRADGPSQITSLLEQGLSMLVMADIGTIAPKQRAALQKWVARGGVLLRFAGPRLAANSGRNTALTPGTDPLIPVILRAGGRNLGSALSWEKPQHLAPFSDKSPLAGLKVDPTVTINRQVLAEPTGQLSGRVWASLSDGTPLITARRYKKGLVVLIHVTANTDWSNLPLTGLFVEILGRLVSLAPAITSTSPARIVVAAGDTASHFTARTSLNGFARLVPPPLTAKAIAATAFKTAKPSPLHPAGLYQRATAIRSLNLVGNLAEPQPLAAILPKGRVTSLAPAPSMPLAGWLFALAFFLFLLDCLAALFLFGSLQTMRDRRHATIVLAAIVTAGITVPANHARAQAESAADRLAMQAVSQTRFAYVVTGDTTVDETSKAGLHGLNVALQQRTSVEPGPPHAIDIEKDPIVFYPLLYWPVLASAKPPSDKAIKKLALFMKNGGTVFFDTRDQGATFANLTGAASPQTRALRRILEKFDIPALEPVPPKHVLTRAFYLMKRFPGRWLTGKLWVEASSTGKSTTDGVSSIIIGANDYAAAWAVNGQNQPLYATIPGVPRQREFAYRTGINIVMYTLTGNYKADQVHVPALLERLGQ